MANITLGYFTVLLTLLTLMDQDRVEGSTRFRNVSQPDTLNLHWMCVTRSVPSQLLT